MITKYPLEEYPNVNFHCADFSQWSPENPNIKYDVIISTIPFTRLAPALLQNMLTKINQLLKQGGFFSYISLVGARTWGAFASDYTEEYLNKMTNFDAWKEENFTETQNIVFRNIPPIWVYHLTKK